MERITRTADSGTITSVPIISAIAKSDTDSAQDIITTCPHCKMLVFGRCPLKILCIVLLLVVLYPSDTLSALVALAQ